MKKMLLILSTISLLSLASILTSCKEKKNEVTNFQYGSMIQDTVIDKNYDFIFEQIRNEKSFILVVEPGNGCLCWAHFKPVLEKYIQLNHVIVYHLKYDQFYGKDSFGMTIKAGYTTFAIFQNGKINQNIIEEDEKILTDEDKFFEFMEKHVVLPHMFYINKDQLDDIYKSEDKTVVYFARSGCGDCQYVDKNFFPQYFNNKDTKIYVFDCQEIYDNDDVKDKPTWSKFKDDYGLSNKYNSSYGFNTGFVPTFLLVNGDGVNTNYLSGAVYFNDEFEQGNDGKYLMSKTYYTEERLPYLQYLNNDKSLVLENYITSIDEIDTNSGHYYWKKEKAAKYHDKLLEKFLDYSLPQITYKF